VKLRPAVSARQLDTDQREAQRLPHPFPTTPSPNRHHSIRILGRAVAPRQLVSSSLDVNNLQIVWIEDVEAVSDA
jgi:hypothetical protein